MLRAIPDKHAHREALAIYCLIQTRAQTRKSVAQLLCLPLDAHDRQYATRSQDVYKPGKHSTNDFVSRGVEGGFCRDAIETGPVEGQPAGIGNNMTAIREHPETNRDLRVDVRAVGHVSRLFAGDGDSTCAAERIEQSTAGAPTSGQVGKEPCINDW